MAQNVERRNEVEGDIPESGYSHNDIAPAVKQMTYQDRLLPNQPFNSNLYKGEDFIAAMSSMLGTYSPSVILSLHRHPEIRMQEMSTTPSQIMILKFLIDIVGAKTFLEVGTFIGSTAMQVAKFIGASSEVVTIEKFDEFAEIAKKNIEINGLPYNVKLLKGDALHLMDDFQDKYFDIIYIDGDKGNYLPLLKIAEKKKSAKGVIVIDDVFFHGDALNDFPETEKGKGCKALLEYCEDSEFSVCLLPIANGMLLLK